MALPLELGMEECHCLIELKVGPDIALEYMEWHYLTPTKKAMALPLTAKKGAMILVRVLVALPHTKAGAGCWHCPSE